MATSLPFLSIPFKTSSSSSRSAKITCSSVTAQSRLAKQNLLTLIADQDRGLKTQSDPSRLSSIINALGDLGKDTVTTGTNLRHVEAAVDDREGAALYYPERVRVRHARRRRLAGHRCSEEEPQQCHSFPPDGVFFVRSDIEVVSPQRVDFRFTSAVLRGKSWEFPLPPFGKGWLVLSFVKFVLIAGLYVRNVRVELMNT